MTPSYDAGCAAGLQPSSNGGLNPLDSYAV
jgi:hypothetical protein